ncbi:unnamed protein product [Calypogeia fissa]
MHKHMLGPEYFFNFTHHSGSNVATFHPTRTCAVDRGHLVDSADLGDLTWGVWTEQSGCGATALTSIGDGSYD